jgi:hypothetical protein
MLTDAARVAGTLPGGGHQRLPGCHRQELAFADELASELPGRAARQADR